jgi:hypothetical protein
MSFSVKNWVMTGIWMVNKVIIVMFSIFISNELPGIFC